MPTYDERLRDIEERLRHDDPGFAASLSGGSPRPPRDYRRGHAWLWLVVGLAALGVGIAVGHGLLIAAGLVVAGVAGQLFDPQRVRLHGRNVPPAR
ncbi:MULTISPECIES: DUF3040 domain-containing protein [unclassified Streptomyces]|uniref:DUF3040 domain-containing protein n=1 Tax=unclassified Streptomyces TaxID=2593676 RepID=UPI00093F60C1|nr:DUF3040 domain-containing protein [Streptomyces sp. TSRI0281]OKI41594.1 hypothetical protein A6A29_37250 [Streptomyces sp. TSRI0281]